MYIIGENIHIISPPVKEAVKNRDKEFFKAAAIKQVEYGVSAVDLNIGPQKKYGHEILPWMVQVVESVVDVPLVFDTTNLAAIVDCVDYGGRHDPRRVRRTGEFGIGAVDSSHVGH
jgi:5-methyltetrahydrofolate corrinoid/iron sulfur protein methyltransferase